MSDGGNGPEAGWYPDPEVPGGQRYWDGSQWGEQRPPAGGSPSWGQAPSWQGGAGPGGAGQGSYGAASAIDPWFWQSIVATVLCCLPLGVVGIVKSSQAKSAIDTGDVATAQRLANEARTWTLWSAGVTLAGIVLWFLFVVVIGIGGAMSGF